MLALTRKVDFLEPTLQPAVMIHRLNVVLEGIEPAISRRIEVPSSWTLKRLCTVLQIAMGWDGSHLDHIRVGGRTFASEPGDRDIYAGQSTVAQSLPIGARAEYVYDFGDAWTHTVSVEAVENEQAGVTYPRCIDGARACPPEDCGGPHGYANLLAAHADRRADDHGDAIEWLGEDFDPATFDIDMVNRTLRHMTPVRVSGEIERLVRLLRHEKLPKKIAAQIVARGAEVVPYLIAFIDDDRFWSSDAPGAGWAPIHAVHLLGELRDPRAIVPLMRAIECIDWEDYVFSDAIAALAKHGAAIVEPCLTRLASMRGPGEAIYGITSALAECGVRDDRIFDAITRHFAHDEVLGASNFAAYKDPRALPLLQKRLDEQATDDPPPWSASDIAGAIKQLGGELSQAQRQTVDRAAEARLRALTGEQPHAAPLHVVR